MPTFNRNGVQIYYEVRGNGPAVLLTHGYAATSQMWKGQHEPFTKDHTLVTWDMRGHGQTDSPVDESEYSAEATVDDIAAILDELKIEHATIGGLSLGGYMSLGFHATYPERVDALLIIDTGPGFKNDAAREAWNVQANGMADTLAKDGVEVLLQRTPEMAQSKHKTTDGLILAGRHMLTQKDSSVIESLPHIAKPTMVIAGADDEPYLNATAYMGKKIPNAQKVIIDNAGHAVNIDQPEAFNRHVLQFLAQQGL